MVIAAAEKLLFVSDGFSSSLWDLEESCKLYECEKRAVAAAFSNDGGLIAYADIDKNLNVLDSSGSLVAIFSLNKRPSKLIFKACGRVMVAADRFGDVYEFNVDNPIVDENGVKRGKLLLGHVSLLTDVAFTKDEKFILTSDRDEKIRVTRYPDTHIIESFLLGHASFVGAILPVDDLVFSGGKELQLLVWSLQTQEIIARIDLTSQVEDAGRKDSFIQSIHFVKGHLVVVLHKVPSLLVLSKTSLSWEVSGSFSLKGHPISTHASSDTVSVLSHVEEEQVIELFELDNDGVLKPKNATIECLQTLKPLKTELIKDVVDTERQLDKFYNAYENNIDDDEKVSKKQRTYE